MVHGRLKSRFQGTSSLLSSLLRKLRKWIWQWIIRRSILLLSPMGVVLLIRLWQQRRLLLGIEGRFDAQRRIEGRLDEPGMA